MFLLQGLLGDNGVLIFPTFMSSAYYFNETYTNIFNFMYLTVANILGIPATHCTMGLNKRGLPIGLQVSNLLCTWEIQASEWWHFVCTFLSSLHNAFSSLFASYRSWQTRATIILRLQWLKRSAKPSVVGSRHRWPSCKFDFLLGQTIKATIWGFIAMNRVYSTWYDRRWNYGASLFKRRTIAIPQTWMNLR